MDSIFWLLLLIIVIAGLIGGSMLFFNWYAKRKDKVSTLLRDTRQQLIEHRERLWVCNKEVLQSFSDLNTGKYGLLVQEYQRNFQKAQESNLHGRQEQLRISRTLPKKEKASVKYWLGGIERVQTWQRAGQELHQLQLEVKENEDRIGEVERSLQALKDQPQEAADLARNLRDVCRQTSDLLEDLSTKEGIGGRTIEESLWLVKDMEMELENVPLFFYNSTPEELASLPNIKPETQKALLILEPARDHLVDLNKQAKDWMAKAEELRKTTGILEDRVRETEVMFKRLSTHLILSGEQEDLSYLCEKAEQVRANVSGLTIENLGPTLDEVKRTLVGLELLNQTLKEQDARLRKLQESVADIDGPLLAVGSTLNSAASRQEYPVVWSNSQNVFEDVRETFEAIPPLSEKRMPADLAKDVETAEACQGALVKLQAEMEKGLDELNQSSTLWTQLRPIFTDEWLAGVERLFSEMKTYEMESNWEPADQAGSLYKDAEELVKRAKETIPASNGTPIDELEIGPKLLAARELAGKKPVFDDRQVRIEARLKQVQEDEKEAVDLHRRLAPVVTLFASRIRSINISTKYARNMLDADAKREELANSLAQRDKGNVAKKLDAVRKWERSTAENGAMVYRWVEDDLFRRKVSISASLKDMKIFAEDLEDDIVVKAHRYDADLEFAPRASDTELVKKQPLDAIQDDAAGLFDEWQEVAACEGELRNFIAPVREEYNQMLSALKNLQEDCSQLAVTLNRDWPPAFQTARYLRAKVDNLEKDVDGIRNVKWKRSELQKNYYFLWQRFRDLDSEADNIRRMDERDMADMQALEKEYLNSIRDHARRIYAGNEAGIRREIASGDVYLKSLVDQHKAGRKNGTNTPSALEVKTLLQRKIDAYKQQLQDYNIARMDDAIHERERGRQFMSTGKEIPVPFNRTEFITTIFRLTTDLQKLSRQHPDIEDAIEELRSAHAECRKSKPVSTEIKRLMNSAKGILVEVEKTVPEVAPVIGAITMMTGVVRNIFG